MLEPKRENKEGQIRIEPVGDLTVVSLSGHIAEIDAESLARVLDELFERGSYKIIFDLTDVSYMTSSGLGQIMRAYRVARDNEGFIRIVNPQSLVADIFRITKLNHIFEIYPDLAAAINPAG